MFPFRPKYIKQAKLLLKGVKKFVRYNDDLIEQSDRDLIDEKREQFKGLIAGPEYPSRDTVEEAAKELTNACEKSVPHYKPSALRENIEVLFVAVVIAMGIRTYIAQPFKIPTGSMQPTLNGVIGHPHQDINPESDIVWEEAPNFLVRAWEQVWFGRTYVDIDSPVDDVIQVPDQQSSERTRFKFFTSTYFTTRKGNVYRVPAPYNKALMMVFGKDRGMISPRPVKAGEPIAKGYVDTGDQVIVDKFSYHWTSPDRDDVFVFNTRDIRRIQVGLPHPNYGSQHYIKRLAGLPGDTIEVREPELYVNGELAEEPGIRKVISAKDGYRGYQGQDTIVLQEEQYLALGDNSFNSSDGRYWGHVPEKNIVGRAILVYYPFGHHFGPIH